MPAYIVATVAILDPARFAEYGKAGAGLGQRRGADYRTAAAARAGATSVVTRLNVDPA